MLHIHIPSLCFFFIIILPPPISTLFPYTTLFRSVVVETDPLALVPDQLEEPVVLERQVPHEVERVAEDRTDHEAGREEDRKSTRLNSSHTVISYAVFCLKKKNKVNVNSTNST